MFIGRPTGVYLEPRVTGRVIGSLGFAHQRCEDFRESGRPGSRAWRSNRAQRRSSRASTLASQYFGQRFTRQCVTEA